MFSARVAGTVMSHSMVHAALFTCYEISKTNLVVDMHNHSVTNFGMIMLSGNLLLIHYIIISTYNLRYCYLLLEHHLIFYIFLMNLSIFFRWTCWYAIRAGESL